ncbi:MAG: hypothetical protein AB1755_00760 [Candidatus Omnitrophota bacterium]
MLKLKNILFVISLLVLLFFITPTIYAQNLIQDGDMELAGVDAWISYGALQIKEKSQIETHDGQQSLHVIAGGQGIQQIRLSNKQNQRFKLTMWYKIVNGSMRLWMGWKTSNSDIEGKVTVFNSRGEWIKFERIIASPSRIGDLRLVIVANGEVYLDDITIEETQEEVVNLLQDGDMELAGSDAWKRYGREPLVKEKSQLNLHDGQQSLHIVNGAIQQHHLSNKQNQAFKLTLWYKIIQGTINPRVGWRSSNTDIEGRNYIFRNLGEWTKHERIVISPEEAGDLRFVVSINGEAYLDDVVLSEFNLPFRIISTTPSDKSLQYINFPIPLQINVDAQGQTLEYKFIINNMVVQDFSSNNSYVWQPAQQRVGNNIIGIEIRNAGIQVYKQIRLKLIQKPPDLPR